MEQICILFCLIIPRAFADKMQKNLTIEICWWGNQFYFTAIKVFLFVIEVYKDGYQNIALFSDCGKRAELYKSRRAIKYYTA